MFLYQGWYLHKEKDTSFFNIMYGKFWFDGEFFVQNLELGNVKLNVSIQFSQIKDKSIFSASEVGT